MFDFWDQEINSYLLFILAAFPNITLQPSGFNQNTIGQRQDIICSISVPPDVDPDTIQLGWLNEEDIVTADGRVTIYESNDYFNDSTLFTVIQFDPLIREDEGEYICYAVINGSLVLEAVNLQNFSGRFLHACKYVIIYAYVCAYMFLCIVTYIRM